MAIDEFLPRSQGSVRIELRDGSVHTGRFRTELLSAGAVSAYFYGESRDLSLPIELIASIESVAG